MEIILTKIQVFLSYAGPFVLLLGVLIFVHELGHFLVAKFFGVRVEVFSLGFGKKLLKFKRGDTTYCVSLIPLGGYVKMFGDDPTAEVPEEDKKYAFFHKPVGPRIAIVLAGPLMNLFFAIFLFACVSFIGEKAPGPTAGDVSPKSAAYNEGFRSGDTFVSVNKQPIATFLEVDKQIKNNPKVEMQFVVQHLGADETTTITATPAEVDFKSPVSNKDKVGEIEGLSYLSRGAVVGISNPVSLAGSSGFKALEYIEKINGKEITFFRQLEKTLQGLDLSKPIVFETSEYKYDKKTKSRTITIDSFSPLNKENLLSQIGFEKTDLFIVRPQIESPAFNAGFQSGDKITAINGQNVTLWEDLLKSVGGYKEGDKSLVFSILRQGQKMDLEVSPKMTEVRGPMGEFEDRFTIGILPAIVHRIGPTVTLRNNNPFVALKEGVTKSIQWTGMIAISFAKLITNQVSAKNIGGIISIGKVAGDTYSIGISSFLRMMALISINLFLINLLPVPVLDGGHLLFFTLEALRGAPMSMRKMEIAQQVGIFLLLFLMAFSFFNDINNLFFASPW